MRWRVSRATRSGGQLLDQVDVLLLRILLRRTLELGPGFVLGGADEIEEAGFRAGYVALRSLLVELLELEQRVVVGALGAFLEVFRRILEARFEIGHGFTRTMHDVRMPSLHQRGACA